MGSVADPKQIEDSILFPEIEPILAIEEAQTDKSSQRTPMCKELLKAAINGRENTLTQLLGLDVRGSPDSAHVTIHEASDNALNQAGNLQSTTHIGNTVLHILAGNGHAELAVKTYMKDRSLLEVCNNREETALHFSARYGHCSVISELINKAHELEHDLKDTLRKKNMHGETALHEAARHGHTATVQTLIREDPELAGQVNKNDKSPLYLATVEGHVAVVRLIVHHLRHREITSAYYSGPQRTALHAAVLRSKKGLYMVNELLQLKSATLAKERDIFGSTLLHYAASTGDVRITRRLLQHDASLAYCDDSLGLFPLHVAAYMGYVEIIVEMLKYNLDSWELLDHRGRNFLHVAAESPRTIISPLIFKAGIQRRFGHPKLWEVLSKASSARDREGNTPLHIAIRDGHIDGVPYFKLKEWIRMSSTSLAAASDSEIQVSKSPTDEKYKEKYQHYEALKEVGEAERFPRMWLRSYHEKRNPSESSGTLSTKVQTIALGSALIATVTFAAAFTPPGGFNSSDGTPVLGRKYAFMAFILADLVAFASSFGCTFYLILLGANARGHLLQKELKKTQYLFIIASIFTGLAFGLGLYVALAPGSKGFSIFVLVATLLAAAMVSRLVKRNALWRLGNVALSTISFFELVCLWFAEMLKKLIKEREVEM
ncbi:Ankyrin repeat protein family-like protein [Rhynchospora pubera]|uniref:Ankyrin repeat protein family-like protein n=1 Tax=Rhynchospora pubera TaxID=906938 RepID=A0AAV8BSI1_9POAL|nr:Ankyrin repeat protein family-like protein [Rhynchospora pubera]